MDKGGISYAQPQTAMLKKGLDDLVANNKFDPDRASDAVWSISTSWIKLATQPQGATLTELQIIRSAMAKQARGADA